MTSLSFACASIIVVVSAGPLARGFHMAAKKAAPLAKETRDAPLSIKIRPSLKRALEAGAGADRRSISAYVEIVLEEVMKAKGFLK